jgi:5-formyltetrahydrofolate cyclo-ligase
MRGEVDASPVALRGWQEQKTIAAPRLSWEQRHMIPVVIRSLDTGLVQTERGLREPAEGDPVPIEMLDLVIVPALAYDRRGYRLGRGQGFYDRFLAQAQFRGVAIGLAFKEQVTERLPTTANDVPVHLLVTDEEVLRFTPEKDSGKGKEARSKP